MVGHGDPAGPVLRVERAGAPREREQLGPDALVDVPVQVDGHELVAVGPVADAGVGDAHQGSPPFVRPRSERCDRCGAIVRGITGVRS
ncbi:hypothetical protein B7486_66610 [cyanobacterium TDX16]|nr:hypothetical protein B7486_66610 [cyanobacterium TDX16]